MSRLCILDCNVCIPVSTRSKIKVLASIVISTNMTSSTTVARLNKLSRTNYSVHSSILPLTLPHAHWPWNHALHMHSLAFPEYYNILPVIFLLRALPQFCWEWLYFPVIEAIKEMLPYSCCIIAQLLWACLIAALVGSETNDRQACGRKWL